MRYLPLLFCVLAPSLGFAQATTTQSPPPKVESPVKLDERLAKQIIPLVDFKDQSLADCAKFFTSAGIPMKLNAEVEKSHKDSKITLQLKNVPAVEALKYVTNLSGVTYVVEAGVVELQAPK